MKKFSAPPLIAALVFYGNALTAFALRPYDSTDAAVAARGEFELELGPLGRLRQGDRRFRVSPTVIGNYGFAEDRELVVQGQRRAAIDGEPGEPRSSVVASRGFMKTGLRHGVLEVRLGLTWSMASKKEP